MKKKIVLAIDILALKLHHDYGCEGITLPNSSEARLTQFADDKSNYIVSDVSNRTVGK